jgi:hypothetical protein
MPRQVSDKNAASTSEVLENEQGEDLQPSSGELADLLAPWVICKEPVSVPIGLLRLLPGTDTYSRAPDNEHVKTHKETWCNGGFDPSTSLFYAVATGEKCIATDLAKVHPHAKHFTDPWLQTDAGTKLGLSRLNVLDGQHRLIGWEQATTSVRNTLKTGAPGSPLSRRWMPLVQVRVLKADTPKTILVSTLAAVLCLQSNEHIVFVCTLTS